MAVSKFDLSGKVAVVTGSRRGIGQAIALGLAEAGADLVSFDRNDPTETRAKVQALGRRYLWQTIDMLTAKPEDFRQAMDQAASKMGQVNILVNNAGTNIRKMPQDYDISEWDQVLTVNLRSVFLCAQAAYKPMKAAGGGKIICIGSMTSIFGGAKLAPYGTSKGGVVQMARSLAAAWAPDNIQVNAILPGWIDTDLTRQARIDLPGLNESVLARTPTGRWGRPSDLAGVAVFLASAAADFVTGVALPVDGGFAIQL